MGRGNIGGITGKESGKVAGVAEGIASGGSVGYFAGRDEIGGGSRQSRRTVRLIGKGYQRLGSMERTSR